MTRTMSSLIELAAALSLGCIETVYHAVHINEYSVYEISQKQNHIERCRPVQQQLGPCSYLAIT